MLDEEHDIFLYKDKIIELRGFQTKLLACLINRKHARTNAETLIELIYGIPADSYLKSCIANAIYRLNLKLKGIAKIKGRHSKGWIIQYIGEK